MDQNKNDEPQNALLNSLRALSGGQNGPLDDALAQFLNGEGELHAATRAATSEGGQQIAALVKFLVDQFNIPPAMATIIATLLIKIAPSIGKAVPKKRKTPRKKKPAAKKKPASASGKKAKPRKNTAKKEETSSRPKARKKPAVKKKPAPKKPTTASKRRKPASKTINLHLPGETP